jgi:hypothetical protein
VVGVLVGYPDAAQAGDLQAAQHKAYGHAGVALMLVKLHGMAADREHHSLLELQHYAQ